MAHSICYTSAVNVPSGFTSPSQISITWNNIKVTNGSPAGDMVVAAQYQTSSNSNWTYFGITGGGSSYYYGAGKYCGDYVSNLSTLTATTSNLPTNITKIRLVAYSNANAYATAVISLGGGTAVLRGP